MGTEISPESETSFKCSRYEEQHTEWEGKFLLFNHAVDFHEGFIKFIFATISKLFHFSFLIYLDDYSALFRSQLQADEKF